MAKSPLEALKEKYMNDPDIIPAKGEDKEPIAEAMAKQQIRQRENNDRAFELLTKAGSNEVDSGSSGGAKEGGDAAMYRLTEFVNKPVEKTDHIDRQLWGNPTKKHLKAMNRPFSTLDIKDVDKIKLDPPPEVGSAEHEAELKTLKELVGLLDNEAVRERINAQDKDLLAPFDRYLRENNLEIDREKFMSILKDTNTIIFKFKYLFNRPRPHQVTDLEEIDNTAGKSPSYPAGHSTTGAVAAELLSEQFPEHAEEFRVIGTEVGYNRVIAGLHYMSDHLAGLTLASQIVPLVIDMKITKSDEFMNELFKYMSHREELLKDMTQIGTQDILDGVRIDKESNPRIPRKKGQPAKSKKHSDLYTDEDPKGTIQGLGFKDDKTARASVKKIRNSNRSHAHKIQAAVAMEQRAKAAGKSSEAGIYRKYINSMKEKTKRLEKHTEEEHVQEHNASDNLYPKVSVDKSKKSLLDQIDQIQSKLVTGDYGIKKSDDIFLLKADLPLSRKLTEEEFKQIAGNAEATKKYGEDLNKFISGFHTNIFESELVIANIKKKGNLGELDSKKKARQLKMKNRKDIDGVTKEIGNVLDYNSYVNIWDRTNSVGTLYNMYSNVFNKSVEELEKPAEKDKTIENFEILGTFEEAGKLEEGADKTRTGPRLITVVARDVDGNIRIASQNPNGSFRETDGFTVTSLTQQQKEAGQTGGNPLLLDQRHYAQKPYDDGKLTQSSFVSQLNNVSNEIRQGNTSIIAQKPQGYKAVVQSAPQVELDKRGVEGYLMGAGEARAYNTQITSITQGEWTEPKYAQDMIENALKGTYITLQEHRLAANQYLNENTFIQIQQEQPKEEEVIEDQNQQNQNQQNQNQENQTGGSIPNEQQQIQDALNRAANDGVLQHIHDDKYGPDNTYHSIEDTAKEFIEEHKTFAKIKSELGKAEKAYKDGQQKAEATIAGAERQAQDEQQQTETQTGQQTQTQTTSANQQREIAQNIVNKVNEMPTLFSTDDSGRVVKSTTANNANMANRFRQLRKLVDLHEGVDEADAGLKTRVQQRISQIDPTVARKISTDLDGLRLFLPQNVKEKLNAEFSRDDYHEDSHKQEVATNRQQSAANEAQLKANMSNTHKKGVRGELFKGDNHDAHQTLTSWTPEDAKKFDAEMQEKYGNPDSPDFKEGGPSKSDLDRERRERGLPPGEPKERKVGGRLIGYYVWHAGTHHWVTPEYIKVHGDMGAGMVRGDVVSSLYGLKDSKNLQAFVPEGMAGGNGLAAIKGDKNQGMMGDTDMILTNASATKNEHDHIDYNNVDYYADSDAAKQAHEMNHYTEKHLNEGQNRTKTDAATGRVLTEDVGNTALQRYGARLKEAGGFTGALARFTAAVLPQRMGGGLTEGQAAKYSSSSFRDD